MDHTIGKTPDNGSGRCAFPETFNIPSFLERILKMIENVSDHIVCWSEAGDSFIIKQVSEQDRSREREIPREYERLYGCVCWIVDLLG